MANGELQVMPNLFAYTYSISGKNGAKQSQRSSQKLGNAEIGNANQLSVDCSHLQRSMYCTNDTQSNLMTEKTAPSKARLNNPMLDSEIPSPECGIVGDDNLVLDDTQEKYAALTILEVKERQADEIRHKVNNLLKRYGL